MKKDTVTNKKGKKRTNFLLSRSSLRRRQEARAEEDVHKTTDRTLTALVSTPVLKLLLLLRLMAFGAEVGVLVLA